MTDIALPDRAAVDELIRRALAEDVGGGDVTTAATIRPEVRGRGVLLAKAPMVVAGLDVARAVFAQVAGADDVVFTALVADGDRVVAGDVLARVEGPAASLLTAERTALNLLQRLSGIATATRAYVDAAAGRITVLDTRKTTPMLRALEKYAVRAGGGVNHRMDLADAILIKDNHLAACDGDVALAVKRVREMTASGLQIEVECERPDQVQAAIDAGAHIVLLDNMSLDNLRESVRIAEGRVKTEASGGVNLNTVRAIAETGVDWISVGALTHSPPALDLALDFD